MIRPAQIQDISRIAEILIFAKRMAYRPIFQNDVVSFNELQVVPLARTLEAPGALAQTFVYDDGIVRAMMRCGVSPETARLFELHELYVDPFFQGTGIGIRLMASLERYALNAHCTHIALWVLEKNTRARSFYERAGFSPTGVSRLEENTPECLLRYERSLSC